MKRIIAIIFPLGCIIGILLWKNDPVVSAPETNAYSNHDVSRHIAAERGASKSSPLKLPGQNTIKSYSNKLLNDIAIILDEPHPDAAGREFRLLNSLSARREQSVRQLQEAWDSVGWESLDDFRAKNYVLYLSQQLAWPELRSLADQTLSKNLFVIAQAPGHGGSTELDQEKSHALFLSVKLLRAQSRDVDEFLQNTQPILNSCNRSYACRMVIEMLYNKYKLSDADILAHLPEEYTSIWY